MKIDTTINATITEFHADALLRTMRKIRRANNPYHPAEALRAAGQARRIVAALRGMRAPAPLQAASEVWQKRLLADWHRAFLRARYGSKPHLP